jgi:hypothetical protein
MPEESRHLKKFFFCSLLGLVVPIAMQLAALYHLYYAIKKREKIMPMQLIFSLLLFIPGVWWSFYVSYLAIGGVISLFH